MPTGTIKRVLKGAAKAGFWLVLIESSVNIGRNMLMGAGRSELSGGGIQPLYP